MIIDALDRLGLFDLGHHQGAALAVSQSTVSSGLNERQRSGRYPIKRSGEVFAILVGRSGVGMVVSGKLAFFGGRVRGPRRSARPPQPRYPQLHLAVVGEDPVP
jgi:hypothetical protein